MVKYNKKIYVDNDEDYNYNYSDDYLINDYNHHNSVNKNVIFYKINIFFNYLFLIGIISLQGIFLYYFIKLANALEEFKTINITEVDDYINKTKTIVDYVCENMISC